MLTRGTDDPLAWLTSLSTIDIFAPFEPEHFIEERRQVRERMIGAATPRRRPRRVAKKLAARGWRVHHNTPGGRRLSETYWREISEAPRLRARLEWCSPHDQTMVRVPDKQLEHEPETRRPPHGAPLNYFVSPPEEPRIIPATPRGVHDARDGAPYYVVRMSPLPSPLFCPEPADDPRTFSSSEIRETWIASDFYCVHRVCERGFHFAFRLHAPEDSFEKHEAVASRLFEHAVHRFCFTLFAASRGFNKRGKLIARQTSYRPFGAEALRDLTARLRTSMARST